MTRSAPLTFLTVLVAIGLLAACGGSKTTPVEVVISLDKTATALKTAKITVDYSQSGATPLLSGGEPACISILPNVNCTFADDGAGTLTITANAQTSFSAPVDLAVCRMVPDTSETKAAQIASRLRVALATGTAKDGKPLDHKRLASAQGGSRKSPDGAASGGGHKEAAGRERAGYDSTGEAAPDSAPGSQDAADMRVNRDDLAAREARRKAAKAAGEASDEAYDSSAAIAARERAAAEAAAAAAAADRAALEDQEALEDEEAETNDPEDSQPVAAYDVRVSVTSDSGQVSALQLDISHLGSSGGWQGAGSRANCDKLVAVNMMACNDSGRGRLRCAFVDLGGFSTPTELLSCIFKSGDAVGPGDFSVQVVDASGPDLVPLNVDVAITSVTQR